MRELQIEYVNQAPDLLENTADWPEISKPKWTCEATLLDWHSFGERRSLIFGI